MIRVQVYEWDGVWAGDKAQIRSDDNNRLVRFIAERCCILRDLYRRNAETCWKKSNTTMERNKQSHKTHTQRYQFREKNQQIFVVYNFKLKISSIDLKMSSFNCIVKIEIFTKNEVQ